MNGYSAAQIYDLANGGNMSGIHGGELLLVLLVAFGLGALFGRTILAPARAPSRQLALPLALPPAQPEAPHALSDDLKRIPGVGPKVEEALYHGGIRTYAELARSSRERLERILGNAGLDAAGVRSWPVMAALIASQQEHRS